ncbi:MAG: NADH-quinone oxidoreductase subunit K [Puniceicoccaceae bacterium]|nr:MAG: NADH-quinone oxidoreductase subunit K [Puniceicoccaceae bacterium]
MSLEPYQLYAMTAGLIFGMSLIGIFLRRHIFHKIIAVNMLGASVFLLLVSFGARDAGAFADPVPHAMVITGLVVAVSASAFALALARRIYRETGRSDFSDPHE